MSERHNLYFVRCAGRLANGFERGKGSLIHASKHPEYGPALCGREPRVQWVRPFGEGQLMPTCKRCLSLMKGVI